MRRILAFLLFCALLTGCQSSLQRPIAPLPQLPAQPADGDYGADYSRNLVRAGKVTTAPAADAGGQLRYNTPYAGATGKDYTDPAQYTFQDALSATAGLKWAPHTWETGDDRYLLEYTTMGFYDFALDADGAGWTILCEMAAAPPEDVTDRYVGRFGITATDSARAWRIRLNPAACWENGVAIDADTYLYSYRELLDGRMMNRRADSLYAGAFAIVGAKDYLYGNAAWEDVGIIKEDAHTLVLITTTPIADPAFTVPYHLTATYLVYEPLWQRCKTAFDSDGKQVPADSAEAVTISTNYCTSLDTSISYGPYKLTYFELDKQVTLQRNEAWYGYADGKHLGQYQTDTVSCRVLPSHATALLAFLSGDLDVIDLSAEDMGRYATADTVRYAPESYTTKLSFNTDAQSLAARGSQILAEPLFRKAFSLAIDRTRFASGFTSAGEPGYGLLNKVYVHDPLTGSRYRDSRGAKNALVQLYGLLPESYGGPDDAHAAITGYDPGYAQTLMQQACVKAMEKGLYDGESTITLQLSVYQAQDLYVQMYHFLQDALALACRGTDLEGKLRLEMVVDADYYAAMESGLTDMIFSTWGGSAYDPYGVLYQCYCDAGVAQNPNQMEYGFDAGSVTVEMTVDDTLCVASLQDWARWCSGEEAVAIGGLFSFRDYDAETRCHLYANLEYAYLSQYVTTPLYYRNAASLVSHKGDYPVKTYREPVGFGGIRFYTYHYDDPAWEAIKQNLQY